MKIETDFKPQEKVTVVGEVPAGKSIRATFPGIGGSRYYIVTDLLDEQVLTAISSNHVSSICCIELESGRHVFAARDELCVVKNSVIKIEDK